MDNEINNRQWREIAIANTIKFIATQSNNRTFSDEEFLNLAKKVYNFMVSSVSVEKEYGSLSTPEYKIEIPKSKTVKSIGVKLNMEETE